MSCIGILALLKRTTEQDEMTYNKFYIFFEDGSSVSIDYPEDWTVEDVAANNNVHSDSVMGPYAIE